MKINFLYGKRVFVLPATGMLEKIKEASADDLRVLIALSALDNSSGEFNLAEMAEFIGCSASVIEASLHFWRGAGIIEFDAPLQKEATEAAARKTDADDERKAGSTTLIRPENRMPDYTSEQIVELLDSNEELSALIDECNRVFGKILNTAEITTILGLRDYLNLESAYILILVAHCVKLGKKSVKYVEKMAFTLCENEIDTPAALEEYLKKVESANAVEGKLRKLFGMKSRALTQKEKTSFLRWCGEWGYDLPIIERAYEITINSINEPSVPYTNKILETWYKAGYKTLEDVEAALTESNAKKSAEAQKSGSFDTDDFFELALRRSYSDK
ncbi:MAG: DnaD domain protein [Clostridiales bacterium]|nr:DnaD domain protein [Clostridiales bacterium]